MRDVVAFLSEGDHPVVASHVKSAAELRDSIKRKHVLIKFTDTQGGTELGVALDENLSSLEGADFDQATGSIEVVGNLTLNYQPVQLRARIDLASLQGTGNLRAA